MGIILDIIVLLTLAITMIFAVRLSRQFNDLKANESQLKSLILGLDNSTNKAKLAIQEMSSTAMSSGEELQLKINKSRELYDELEMVVEAGDNLAGRLQIMAEKTSKSAPSQKKPIKKKAKSEPIKKPKAKPMKKIIKKDNNKNMSQAEIGLMEALKNSRKAE